MAKKKAGKPETKSEFLRNALTKNPNLDFQQINRRWVKAGHIGEISNALYYQVRAKLGIRTVWEWVRNEAPISKNPNLAKTTDLLFQFKITLLDIKPKIWRRIQVPDCTLVDFHEYIQAAFGWENYHLHQFEIEGVEYSQPAPDGDDVGVSFVNEIGVLLSQLLPKSNPKARWIYEYDFGDCWRHEVLFEGFPPADPKAKTPICLEGKRACPPEDCGGPWGYGDYLAAIADPEHEQHEEMLEWRGPFDPEAFDEKKTTKEMRKMK